MGRGRPTVTAQLASTCTQCQEPVEIGQKVTQPVMFGPWVHVGCAGRYARSGGDTKRLIQKVEED